MATATPAAAAERVEFVDALRGLALFGVFWANLLVFGGVGYLTHEQRAARFGAWPDRAAFLLERFLVENKFIGLFSLLFGISFWLFISRARARGGGTALFYRRIAWLFLFGLLHGALLWWGDVLRFYALWALLLPPFALIAPRVLLATALAAGVLVPALIAGVRQWGPPPTAAATDFDALVLAAFSAGSYGEAVAANLRYDAHMTFSIGHIPYQLAVFGRLLLGLYVARTLPLGNLEAVRPLLRRTLAIGLPLGLVGSTIFTGMVAVDVAGRPALAFARRFLIEAGQMGLTLAYAAGLALLFLSARWRPAVRVLAPIGRMALTWYLLQTLFGVWVFYGFAQGPALMGKVGAAPVLGLALLGFAAQLALARLWLSRFRFGPAEWLWRTLTYGKRPPLRVALPASLAAALLTAGSPVSAQPGDREMAPRETRIAVAGATLHARTIGRGPSLVVLHGGPDFDHAYLLPDLDRLKDRFRLVYYDQRGRGRSAEGVRPADVTLQSDVEDLDRVRQHFGLESSALLGHSWGAVLALEYARRHPAGVSLLVLMNPAPVSASDLALLRQAYLEKLGAAHERQKEIVAGAAYRAGDPEAVAERYRAS
jgi:uncharacterized membrane protein YeiB